MILIVRGHIDSGTRRWRASVNARYSRQIRQIVTRSKNKAGRVSRRVCRPMRTRPNLHWWYRARGAKRGFGEYREACEGAANFDRGTISRSLASSQLAFEI